MPRAHFFGGFVFLPYLCTGFQKTPMNNTHLIQLLTAAVLSIGGMVLLFWGTSIDPRGQIDDSLLVAFGELATFAGALFGIDYVYKIKNYVNHNSNKKSPSGQSHPRLDGNSVQPKDS